MKITLTEKHKIIYQKTTHQIEVDIEGVKYKIRQTEDDNGTEYFVFSDALNAGKWMDPQDMEDSELKDILVKLAETCLDNNIYGQSNVGKEVDMDELEDY